MGSDETAVNALQMRVCWSLVGHDPPMIHIAASLRQLGALHPNS